MKKDKHIYAVLLAGGRGKRLWPVSRPDFSKSFISFKGNKPPILNAIDIIKPAVGKGNILVVTTESQARLVKKLGKLPQKNILIEPFSKNTASAIGLAALHLVKRDPEAVMIALPTDQFIRNKKGFLNTVRNTVKFINSNKDALVVMGIKPTYPATKFGYINTSPAKYMGLYKVVRFREKPTLAGAKALISKKGSFWNAGIFVWRADTLLAAFKNHAPFLYKNLGRVRDYIGKRSLKSVTRRVYKGLKDISIDYLLMERAKNVFCAMAGFDMFDIGSWASLDDLYIKNKDRNVFIGDIKQLDTSDSIVYSTEKHRIALVGVKNMIVVHAKEGTLVCDKQSAEKVRLVG